MAASVLQCSSKYICSVSSTKNNLSAPGLVSRAYDPSSTSTSKSCSTTSRVLSMAVLSRRQLTTLSLSSWFGFSTSIAQAEGLPTEAAKRLCDTSCESELENIPAVTTPSGLQYKDIVIGAGPSPPVGYQVAANYIAMIPTGQIFDSSLEKGSPYIFRVGAGVVIKGLDEGILSMKVGGKRRLYVPGSLAFPKGLSAAAGRPRVLPNTPVIFDVSLEYIPGLSDTDFE